MFYFGALYPALVAGLAVYKTFSELTGRDTIVNTVLRLYCSKVKKENID